MYHYFSFTSFSLLLPLPRLNFSLEHVLLRQLTPHIFLCFQQYALRIAYQQDSCLGLSRDYYFFGNILILDTFLCYKISKVKYICISLLYKLLCIFEIGKIISYGLIKLFGSIKIACRAECCVVLV